MRIKLAVSILAATIALAGLVHAGTIIETNVPTGTTIVNLSGTDDGASGNFPSSGEFSEPYNTDPALVLPAGTYSFAIVDPADAAAEFPALTSTQLAEVQTGWSYNVNTPPSFTSDYIVFDSLALTDSSKNQLFDGANNTPNAADVYATAQDAYDAATSGGYRDDIRIGSRFSSDIETSYTLSQTTTLIFALPDYALSDNAGGISVVVQAVPEPSTYLLLLLGAGLLVTMRNWSRRRPEDPPTLR